jgi:hypothetical protein
MPKIKSENVPFLKNRKKLPFPDKGILQSIVSIPQLYDTTQMQIIRSGNDNLNEKLKELPLDSMRVDIFPDDDISFNYNYNEIIKFLEYLRLQSKQWWINKSIDPTIGYLRNVFPSNKFGEQIGDMLLHTKGRTPFGIEKAITNKIWHKAIKTWELGVDIQFEQTLALDAYYYLAINDLRRFILDAATACEVIKNKTLERLWKKTDFSKSQYDDKINNGNNLFKHLDGSLVYMGYKSLKKERPETWKWIKNLWLCRGNVAHGKSLFYYDEFSKKNKDLNEEDAKKMIDAVWKTIDWLRDLE